jgi:RNA polymerase-associated protein RTF1
LEEVEREQILYDRFEQRNKLKIQRERLKIEGKLKPRANSGQRGQAKRKGTEQTRSTAEKKQQSLSDIRARRQANKDKGGAKPPPRSEIPDIDVDRNRSKPKATQKSSESSARATVNIQLHQLQHIVIKRSNLEAWFREAYFENLVTGCFARVLVGQDRGNKVYRLAQVKGISIFKTTNNTRRRKSKNIVHILQPNN